MLTAMPHSLVYIGKPSRLTGANGGSTHGALYIAHSLGYHTVDQLSYGIQLGKLSGNKPKASINTRRLANGDFSSLHTGLLKPIPGKRS